MKVVMLALDDFSAIWSLANRCLVWASNGRRAEALFASCRFWASMTK
jgi:hypothetical protein